MKALGDAQDFPAASKSTYLNAAAVALMYAGAAKAIADWQNDLTEYGTIKFGDQAEQDVFLGAHRAAARLFSCRPEDIAVASSATELLATLAWGLMPGPETNIVSTEIMFPTAIYPWARVARQTGTTIRLAPDRNGVAVEDELLSLIDNDTAVVCISHVEFGSGQQYDLAKFAEIAHAHEALLIVDATQSAGAVPIDGPACDADVILAAGYKWLCGPFGAALMYVAPRLQNAFEPGLVGFRSNKDIWHLDPNRIDYPDDASRFEFSTMAYGCAIGLAESVDYLTGIGVDRIFAHNLGLADQLLAGLDRLGASVLSPVSGPHRSSIISARFAQKSNRDIVPALSKAGIVVSPRRDFVRFSPHLYNSGEDIERVLCELERVIG